MSVAHISKCIEEEEDEKQEREKKKTKTSPVFPEAEAPTP